MTHALFSFGTLRLDRVQQALFGRAVPTTPDALAGARLGEVRITDPAVIAASGTDLHPGLLLDADAGSRVEGAVLELDDAELAAADRYEEAAYRRVEVALVSGRAAWVYVPKAPPEG
ncbi:gamma-glutamylcyclotransferase family protein [Homoserinibacter sp. YIM 151385]|uniref:gamma-glutamylcyclotransferase family protein n=1 Tax=Homoserinibacter sp. YIM 151385 TaxID=2985506 RepID=UPI0022F127AF|nr:gamma-glutamylcyclotransferase family protein [Homoserinibacter sp. YIM 151385]WBU37058.1 gamma-glutamylcyclotransferase [Homoserinibacter sp. YIM 151385]